MISTLIFEGAERAPDDLAIVCDGRRLSYGELARAIEAVIQAFEQRGVGGDGYALLAMSDMLNFWIISLALRELGLTTLATMSVENAAAAKLSNVALVVTDLEAPWPGLQALCGARGWRLMRAGWDGAMARPAQTGRPRAAAVGEHILQTSATTGAYKMVVMGRDFERAFLHERHIKDGTDRNTRQALFDFGGWTGAGYKSGGSVWMAGGAVILDGRPGNVHRCLEEPGLSRAVMLPDHLATVAENPGAIPWRADLHVYVGGATPRQALIDRARELLSPHIFNSLGCTEAITFAQTRLEVPDDRRWHRLRPERLAHVVDEADNPLPPGQVGRIRVSTADGPTRYLNDPQATAAFFKDGWFYPGDLGLVRASDGRLALMGRTTDVINVWGQKISPAPLEDQLVERLGVSGVCLFGRQNDEADEELHLVIEARAPLEMAALTAAVQETLSGFPRAHIHYQASLPRNGMGKLMRTQIQRSISA